MTKPKLKLWIHLSWETKRGLRSKCFLETRFQEENLKQEEFEELGSSRLQLVWILEEVCQILEL
jgi:hypothetical protein